MRYSRALGFLAVLLSACAQVPGAPLAAEADPGLACGQMAQAHPGSSAIVLNQLGFLTSGSKRAVLQSSARESLPWVLKDEDARIVLEGRTEVFGRDEASGTSVHRIDLSAYAVPSAGLVLEVCGQISRPFAIADATYTNLAEDALRYFYHNRIGTPIEARFAGGEAWARPPALEGLRASCFAGKDRFGNDWPGCAYTLSVEGSWYDAGDFGVYPVNLGISVWTLQSAFERLQTRGLVQAAGWDDGRLALPETGNGVSELLDEARWGMESLLRLQIPDGQTAAIAPGAQTPDKTGRLRIASADVGGMVHHKLAGLTWPPLPVMPQDADARRFLYPPSTAATLSLAATAAQSARLWQGKDDAFAERCLLAAQRAWQAALRHPDILAYDNFDGSGGYGDSNLKDEFAWAAWELHLTTGEASYRDAFDTLQGGAPFAGRPDNFGWADKSLLPALSAAHSGLALPDAPRAQLLAAADAALRIADKTGYRVPLGPTEYEWGSNSQVLNRAIILATAFDLTGAEPYRDGVIDAMDYLLGRNVLGQSFVSGYGERAMRAPHHRIWGGAVDARFPLPPPGALSGGPNANAMADPVAQAMKGKCAPQACWVDDVGAYSLNEVAINWNAPLVWATVFLDQTSRTSR